MLKIKQKTSNQNNSKMIRVLKKISKIKTRSRHLRSTRHFRSSWHDYKKPSITSKKRRRD